MVNLDIFTKKDNLLEGVIPEKLLLNPNQMASLLEDTDDLTDKSVIGVSNADLFYFVKPIGLPIIWYSPTLVKQIESYEDNLRDF